MLTPRAKAAERLALIRRILALLVDEFGRYPHPDLEVVEMPNAAMGGPGNGTSLEGFLVISPDVIDRASLLTLAHEIAHQWWADSVFAVGQAPVLLAETMANYGGLLALEGLYGERAAAEVRWRGFPGEPPITGGRGYLTLARAGLDEPLTSSGVDGLVAGSKGMLAHDLLSRTLGRERFKTVLRNFAALTRFRTRRGRHLSMRYERPNRASAGSSTSGMNGAASRRGPCRGVSRVERSRGVITQSAPFSERTSRSCCEERRIASFTSFG